jgi:hypothetical protein
VAGISLEMVGIIMMLGGIAGIVLGFAQWRRTGVARRTEVGDDPAARPVAPDAGGRRVVEERHDVV